ncbi:MAG TPA: PhzF family phenazine biosynthesis protein [Candidatus Baltobacteraceae bacterium]|nr:PhzF family phenazine biosynthesis protein [Candidatus Baltobacteraceae bacterium]
MRIDYQVVDVFTERPLQGNALAVFPEARDLSEALMQMIAKEMNLSETTFIVTPSDPACAARVRIFTPAYEMKFAGHPTVGTAHVMLQTGWVEPDARNFALEEGVGPVPVRVENADPPLIWLRTPKIEVGAVCDAQACADALSLSVDDLLPDIPCRILSAGNPNLYVAVRDPQTVDRAQVDTTRMRALQTGGQPICLYVFAPTKTGAYSRMFAPEIGVVEDPATGSAAGPLVAHMMQEGLAPSADGTRLLIEQGTKMGRRSLLHILVHGHGGSDGIEVGGNVVTIAHATMDV